MITTKELQELCDDALSLARLAHFGQWDKAGSPYIEHPIRVAERAYSDYILTTLGPFAEVQPIAIKIKTVGYLHDVVEDSFLTLPNLGSFGFPDDVVSAVDSVTKDRPIRETYESFVLRASVNPLGKWVKLADVRDHLAPRNDGFIRPDHMTKKYKAALIVLEEACYGPSDLAPIS